MGQIKNIKLHIVTDIKMEEEVDFLSEAVQPISHNIEVDDHQPTSSPPPPLTIPSPNSETRETEEQTDKQPQKQRDPNRFPHARVRNIMRMDPDLTIASQESVFLITKAAELFVQLQAQEAYKK